MRAAAVAIALFTAGSPARAWNAAGHEAIAALAYNQLTPATRSKVDALLARHPAVAKWDSDHTRYARKFDLASYRFLEASVWPDELRTERCGPSGCDAACNSVAHCSWHYTDLPLRDSHPEPRRMAPERPDLIVALTETQHTLSDANAPEAVRAEALAWMLHLVGDAHQPLHCATALTHEHPRGDSGGNDTEVQADGHAVKLHAYWDALLGTNRRPANATALASRLLREHPAGELPELRSATGALSWVLEGQQYALSNAYPSGFWKADGPGPIAVDARYEAQARQTAERRAAVAGYRLANVIEKALGSQ